MERKESEILALEADFPQKPSKGQLKWLAKQLPNSVEHRIVRMKGEHILQRNLCEKWQRPQIQKNKMYSAPQWVELPHQKYLIEGYEKYGREFIKRYLTKFIEYQKSLMEKRKEVFSDMLENEDGSWQV